MHLKIDINPNDWAQTPPTIQHVINVLVNHLNGQQVEVQSALNRLLQVYQHATVKRTPRQVMMIAPHVTARQYKYACSLHNLGWEVLLVHQDPLNFQDVRCFAKIIQCNNELDFLSHCLQHTPTVYHIFTGWKFELPAFLINSGLSPVLFDDYDLVYGCVNEENLPEHMKTGKALELERYCLENASALTMRDTRLNLARSRTPLNPSKPVLCLDGACTQKTADHLRVSKRTDGIHAVFVGNMVSPDSQTPRNFHFELAKILSNANIHYHIYPSQLARYEEYLPVMNKYVMQHSLGDFVHLHKPVTADTLITEISQYHFGIDIVTTSVNRTAADHPLYLVEYTEHGLDNKLFDYISAGLFTFAHSGKACMRILERYDLGMTISSLQDIATEAKARYEQPPAPIPEVLTTDYWCKRLINVYQTLAN